MPHPPALVPHHSLIPAFAPQLLTLAIRARDRSQISCRNPHHRATVLDMVTSRFASPNTASEFIQNILLGFCFISQGAQMPPFSMKSHLFVHRGQNFVGNYTGRL